MPPRASNAELRRKLENAEKRLKAFEEPDPITVKFAFRFRRPLTDDERAALGTDAHYADLGPDETVVTMRGGHIRVEMPSEAEVSAARARATAEHEAVQQERAAAYAALHPAPAAPEIGDPEPDDATPAPSARVPNATAPAAPGDRRAPEAAPVPSRPSRKVDGRTPRWYDTPGGSEIRDRQW